MRIGKEVAIPTACIPEEIQVGDLINGQEIVEIIGLVNGKPTWASGFVVKVEASNEK